MAVTKIKPVKSTLSKALAYIMNPDKTDDKLLVSSFACSYETADIEFEYTLSKALAKGNNLAHHLMQSFEPGESTPEQAHDIGRKLADEVLGGKYEYVLTTHIDKGHIHNHILFCAADFVTHHKYVSNRKSYAKIRQTNDRLCKEYGLSVVEPKPGKGKHYAEYMADKTGGSWKSKLKLAIDAAIPQAKDFDDFLRLMEEAGHEIKRGKHISFRAPEQERFTRAKTLGDDYTEDAIAKRISGKYVRAPRTHSTVNRGSGKDANLLIDIEKNIKAQQSVGFAHWAKINNLKEAAKTLNYLTENGLLHYADLEAKAAEVATVFGEVAAALKVADACLSDMAVVIKHIETYQQTKTAADGLTTAKDKTTYCRSHESELMLHEAAAKAIKAIQPHGDKLPNLALFRAEHAKLKVRKDTLKADYAKLKKQARDIGIIKRNVDSILSVGIIAPKGKDKSIVAEL
jgi:hypothetical protein